MLKQTKIQLFASLLTIFTFSLPIISVLLFPKHTFYAIKIIYIFPIFIIITPFLSIGKWRIGGEKAKTEYSIFKWLLNIFIAEIGITSLFLIKNGLLINALIKTGNIYPSHELISKVVIPSLFMNPGLLPWTFFALVASHFAYQSYTTHPHLAFSAHIFTKSKQLIVNLMRRTANIYIIYITRAFIILNICFISLQIHLFFYPQKNLFTPLHSILIGSILLIIFSMKTFQNIIKKSEKLEIRQGIHIISIIILALLTIFSVTFMLDKVSDQMTEAYKQMVIPLSTIEHPGIFLSISNWCFWILGAPLFCSLLVKFSHGRTIRQFLCGVLAAPILLAFFGFIAKDTIQNIITALCTTHWIYIPLITGLVLSINFLLDKKLHTYLWLGFIPVKPLKGNHRNPPEQIWMLSAAIISAVLILHLTGAVSIAILGAPAILIFISLLFHKTNEIV